MTQNQIAFHNAKELERHNRMTEEETKRHQLRAEELQSEANALQRENIAVNQMHYERLDRETQRANRAREIENYRSDIAGESIKSRANEIQSAVVAETSRHNAAMEALQESLNASTISKQEAEMSVASANAGLIQMRTGTEMFNQLLVQQQIKNQPVMRDNTRADTTVKNSQVFVNASSVVKNAFSGASELVQMGVPVGY